jgi:tryptophan synthase alpha chain
VNRITQRFNDLATQGRKAFIPYITAGDPSLATTAKLVSALDAAGSDVIELGVPFSDPVADGVVNQEAAQRALAAGTTLRGIVAMVGGLRAAGCEVPIVLFTYFNPVLAYGLETFTREASEAGIDGVLCVDLPPEEAGEYKTLMDAWELATIFLAAPTSTEERMGIIARASTGFLYYVSRTGVTGERTDLAESMTGMVARVKAHTNTPVAVGFGISTPEQAAIVAQCADGVIVGSAIVRMVGQLGDAPDMVEKVAAFAGSLAAAVKGI